MRNKALHLKIESIILEFEKANNVDEIQNVKKLIGFRNYYRKRLGEYRVGIETIEKIQFVLSSLLNEKKYTSFFSDKNSINST